VITPVETKYGSNHSGLWGVSDLGGCSLIIAFKSDLSPLALMMDAKFSISASVVAVIFFSCSSSAVDLMAGRVGAYSCGARTVYSVSILNPGYSWRLSVEK
jgi:hypothetical protein